MVWKTSSKGSNKFFQSEQGTIRKGWRGRISVALVYPNTYNVGMSNLGFQTTYKLFNKIEHVVCERAFLSFDHKSDNKPITSIESGRSIADFDIIAFSVSFENDYLNILTILKRGNLPLLSVNRDSACPLVMAGGVAFFLNPEPVAPFIDCFIIGEAEGILKRFFEIFRPDKEKESNLRTIARNLPGIYIPSFYEAAYHSDGKMLSFKPLTNVPAKVRRTFVKDISDLTTCSVILTNDTTFNQTFLIETGRGCPHGCRFCSAGYIYRPPRLRDVSLIEKSIRIGASITDKIGLVGAAVTDIRDIGKLCSRFHEKELKFSFSSLRADALDSNFIAALKKSKVKTATIAPDAGSERMRRVINKGITEDDIMNAVEILVAGGIPNIKLYFMIGLPTETAEDVEAIILLCKEIKQKFLNSSRVRKRIGEITISLNCFVPKPFTPFQWVAMEDVKRLKKKIKIIKNGLKKVANLHVNADNPRRALIQALLSRGDRRVSQILLIALENSGNWAKTFKSSSIDPAFYAYRERSMDELFPWDFIDHGITKAFLDEEYKKAIQGKTSQPCPMESCTKCGACSR